MKALAAVLGILAALVAQTLLSRFLVHGRLGLDLVLVAVVYLGLAHGPVAGIFAGTLGGLAQDALATGILGISGLAKTVVGFLAGVAGRQFIVSQTIPRFVVFVVATLVQVGVVTGLEVTLGLRPLARTTVVTLLEAAGNGLVGIVVFQLTDLLPGAVERRRGGRESLRAQRLHD